MMEKPTVVITGASTGIGEACARYLAQRGFRIYAGVRKQADANRLTEKHSADVTPLFVDVTEEGSITQAAETVGKSIGDEGLAGLVNNAGVSVGGPLEILPIERLRMQLEVNLIGQIVVTKAFLPLLRRAKGRIVNMGSISCRVASPMLGPYAMSKFGLSAFSDSLRRELRPWGIHVSLIEPGAIATPIWDKAIERATRAFERLSDEARELYGEAIIQARQAAEQMAADAIPPVHVARAVHHALTSKRPRTRYLVGTDAKISACLVWLLPDRAMDWIYKRMGMKRARPTRPFATSTNPTREP